MGTAYKRGRTWTASVTVRWHMKGDALLPIKRTKGGFRTKKEAPEHCAKLFAQDAPSEYADITFSELFEKWSEYYEDRIAPITMAGHKAAYRHFKPIHHLKFALIGTEEYQKCVDACKKSKHTEKNTKSLAMLMGKYAGILRATTHNYAQYIYCGKEIAKTKPASRRTRSRRSAADWKDQVCPVCLLHDLHRLPTGRDACAAQGKL